MTSNRARTLGVAVRAVVERADDGRILLLQRSANVHTDPGLWEIPGGKLEYGEAVDDTLIREVGEETGLTIVVGPPFSIVNFAKEPFWVTCETFACRHGQGEVRLSEEHDDFAWVAAAQSHDRPLARLIREQLDAYLHWASDDTSNHSRRASES
jgi:8-oxo-dGTP diphosphatase